MAELSQDRLLLELKNYLLFLKDSGFQEIPVGTDLDPVQAYSPAPTTSQPTHGETVIANRQLAGVRDELGDCLRCKLSQTRKTIVFGSGNPNADLVFVGEGPGADEDEQGLPFVGRAEISSGSGSRLPGGRHLTILQM